MLPWAFPRLPSASRCAEVDQGFACIGYTAYCGARVYSSQKGADKDDEELSSIPVLLKAGLSLETQWAFMQLGIPGGLMMAAEASSYDVTTALAGLLGVARNRIQLLTPEWSTGAVLQLLDSSTLHRHLL